MDSSTIIFVITIITVFIFLRWLIAPIPDEVDPETTSQLSNTPRNTTNNTTSNRRPVTDSMIEVVHTIAPALTVEQIRYDLESTGSVEVTINRYMENNSLPFPPDYVAPTTTQPSKNKTTESISNINLFEKYNIDLINPKPQDNILHQKRQDMIINARKRLEKN